MPEVVPDPGLAVDQSVPVQGLVRVPDRGLDRCPAVGHDREAARADRDRVVAVVRNPVAGVAVLPVPGPDRQVQDPDPDLEADRHLVPDHDRAQDRGLDRAPDLVRVPSRPDLDLVPAREADREAQLLEEDRAAALVVAPAVNNVPEADPSEDKGAGQIAKQLIVSLSILI